VFLMISQLALAKTNKGRVLHGHATRHKDVRRCCAGGLSFCFVTRFEHTREFEDMTTEHWQTNERWFDIELLIDVATPGNTRQTSNDSHGGQTKEAL